MLGFEMGNKMYDKTYLSSKWLPRVCFLGCKWLAIVGQRSQADKSAAYTITYTRKATPAPVMLRKGCPVMSGDKLCYST